MYVSIPKVAKPNRSSCDGCDRRWKSVQGECFYLMIRTHKWIICWYTIIYIYYDIMFIYSIIMIVTSQHQSMRWGCSEIWQKLENHWDRFIKYDEMMRWCDFVASRLTNHHQDCPAVQVHAGQHGLHSLRQVLSRPATVETFFSWDDMMISYHEVHLAWL